MSLSWPAVIVVAALGGAVIGVAQPRDAAPAAPVPTARAAAPEVAASGERQRPRGTSPERTSTPTPRSPTRVEPARPSGWPAPVESTLPRSRSPQVALTFDDGPGPFTPAVLDVLARYGVPATFCLVGEQIPGREEVVARIAEEGHTLCNHTTSHDYALPVRSPGAISREIATTTQRISSAAPDAPVTVFRAPAGRFEPSVVQAAAQQGLTSWAWSVDQQDWRRTDPDAIVAAVLDDIRPGAVVVLHDGGGDRSATVAALESFVPLLQSVGYEFVPLP